MCQSFTTQGIQRNSMKAMIAPVFGKPPTPLVESAQNVPPSASLTSNVTVRTSLPSAECTTVPQKQNLKEVASEDDDTSLAWRIFSIDW